MMEIADRAVCMFLMRMKIAVNRIKIGEWKYDPNIEKDLTGDQTDELVIGYRNEEEQKYYPCFAM